MQAWRWTPGTMERSRVAVESPQSSGSPRDMARETNALDGKARAAEPEDRPASMTGVTVSAVARVATESCPRLIEVALPIRELSAECSRDARLGLGHISTLHQWWARRPLAASRAVVFASLVPDPDDPRCPEKFRLAVREALSSSVPRDLRYLIRGRKRIADADPYRPYDEVADTLRNRLLMFIAKWSREAIAFERGRLSEEPASKDLLDDRSLAKWETTDPRNPQGLAVLRVARDLVRVASGGKIASVLDPFAGGGAIPLEAGRLGCLPFANDYNPVANLILRATCEYPQRFAPVVEASALAELESHSRGRKLSPLARDVERWIRWVYDTTKSTLDAYYPPGKDGRPVVAYFWARTVHCNNPTCRGEIPLLRSLHLFSSRESSVALRMDVNRKRREIAFGILKGRRVGTLDGTKREHGPAVCPFCDQTTSEEELRKAGQEGRIGERMVAVCVDDRNGKDYRPVEDVDLAAFNRACKAQPEKPCELILPEITQATSRADVTNSSGIRIHQYGMKTWGDVFNPRQLLAMQTFAATVREAISRIEVEVPDIERRRAISVYLGLWLSRNAMRMSTLGRWYPSGQKFQPLFDGAKVSWKCDYPEANPFSASAGSFLLQSDYVIGFIDHESQANIPAKVSFGDGAAIDMPLGQVDVTITDPPYFDEVSYADLSDFFYVWLKRSLGEVFPEILVTPQTPKSDEATALRHRHGGDESAADSHFSRKLAEALLRAKRVTKEGGLFAIIFANQETDAWTALVRSLFDAGLTIDATWPIEMEMKNRTRSINSAALETSIAVICRARTIERPASFREVKSGIEEVVAESIRRFWSYGFRGADLIVACYGPAVGVFGRHAKVERADGTLVGIPELLSLARRAAINAIAGEFRGDEVSTLYYVWTSLYGTGEQAWDDARLVVQMGTASSDAMEDAKRAGVFVIQGSSCRLALLADRKARKTLGLDGASPLIDVLHRAMLFWEQEKRAELVRYLKQGGFLDDGAAFWKLAQALFEVLPRESPDWKWVGALLGEQQTLRVEGQRISVPRRAEKRLEEFDVGEETR